MPMTDAPTLWSQWPAWGVVAANLIVANVAARHGVSIDWRRHMTVGVPVTLGSMSVLWLWTWVMP